MRILCLGASFTGRYLADQFSEHAVVFLSRDPADLARDSLQTYNAHTAHSTADSFDLILDTIPAVTGPDGARPGDHPYADQIAAEMQRNPSARLVHISSTSVYPAGTSDPGATNIPRFNEDTPAAPPEPRGRTRLDLERKLLGRFPDTLVIRATGIYGPGRSLALTFQAGDFRRAAGGNKLVSRIHVHDLCRLVLAQALHDDPPRILVAVDRRPTANAEVFAFLEERLGIAIPGEWRDLPPAGRAMSSKYCEELLGGTYRFPTYREGFEHSLTNARD